MSLDMLLLDSKATLMAASVAASRVPTYGQQLTAGSMYSVAGFDVARCNPNFRLSDSSLLIRFNDTTSLSVLTEPSSPLPDECFRFRSDSEFFGLANSNTQLPDLVGEITAVKSTVSDTPGEKNHLMVTIKMDTGVSVTLSMFDAHAVSLHTRLESMSSDPRVIVATSLNPKIVGGRLFLNATSGTHIYFDKETNAGETFFYKLVATGTGLRSAAPLLKRHAKVEQVTIYELNEFVISAQTQDIDFICSGRVTGIKMDKGWCYVACSKCTKKLQRTASAFTCMHCDNPHAVGALRYRVEMGIADDTAEGVFVCFDGVMTKLHNLQANEAGHMLAGEGVNPEDTQVPAFILDMEGKTYTFQVRVTAYNFTANHQTFTITRILKERERAPLPGFVDNGANGDAGDDMPGANTAPANVEAGSSGERSALDTGAALPAKAPKRPSANASSKVGKKACIG
ncbi:hypothetical protein N665_2102s0004 [Sinapis alba]|nr:hypothetical protein N665_2102s0004 [Sinapis alba]